MANISVIPTNSTQSITLEDLAAMVVKLTTIVGEVAPPINVPYLNFNGNFTAQFSKYTGTNASVLTFSVDGVGTYQQTNVNDGQVTLVLPNTYYPTLGQLFNVTLSLDNPATSIASTFTASSGAYLTNTNLSNGQYTGTLISVSGSTTSKQYTCYVTDGSVINTPITSFAVLDGAPANFALTLSSGTHTLGFIIKDSSGSAITQVFQSITV